MTALAAAALGYRTHILTPEADCPAAQVTSLVTVAGYLDTEAVAGFAKAVDVVTYETENIPLATLEVIEPLTPVRPGSNVLRIAQDRLREKDYLHSIDVATTQYREINSAAALTRAIRDFGQVAVLKTVRMGYDGKGQVMVGPETDPKKAWATMGAEIGILEAFVDHVCEISVVVVRTETGAARQLSGGREPAFQPYPRHHHRAGPDRPGDRRAGRGDRPPYRRAIGCGGGAGGRDVRDPERRHPGERTGAATP